MAQTDTYPDLASAILSLDTKESAQRFLVDLCTPAELRALSERWHVAQMLEAGGMSYREIQAETGVSTTTIGRVARFLREEPHGGYRTVLEQMKDKA